MLDFLGKLEVYRVDLGPMTRPRQAVILAGGRGTRLRPLTDLWPKPLVAFHGKPFLEYLLLQLKENGFERALLLLGYRAEAVISCFGDGTSLGIKIEYSVSPEDWETGARLRAARERLEPVFLLMYCDNYWPMPLAAMWERFVALKPLAMVTIYRNADNYTRSNVRVGEDSLIEVYDKSRSMDGLAGVDIGFIITRVEALDLLPEGNVSFEATVYPQLVRQRALAAFVTDHRYYSVGSVDRLAETEAFLARRPAVLLDRDGVLNERPERAQYVTSWKDWRWRDGALEALRLLAQRGFTSIVLTNQAGVARGHLTVDDLADIHRRMADEAASAGGRIAAVYFCPHHWDSGCGCRKPKPGMFFAAQRDFRLDLTRTVYIGDDERDGIAAAAAFCPFRAVGEEGLLGVVRDLVSQGLPTGS